MAELFTVDPKEVRRIANRMGIPENQELPPVQVEDRDCPSLHKYRKRPYYAVLIPTKSLSKITKDTYTLGAEAIDDIRHELVHYVGRKKNPRTPDHASMGIDKLLRSELEADFTSGMETKVGHSSDVASIVYAISEERGIPVEEVMRRTERIGSDMNISSRVMVRARNILIKHGHIKTDTGSLSDKIGSAKELRSVSKEETIVREHTRSKPSGGRGKVRRHIRRLSRRS